MRITLIETSPAEAEAYFYVRSKLQNSYSLLSEVYMADTSKLMEGKGKERGIEERQAFFSPPPLPNPFFETATQANI